MQEEEQRRVGWSEIVNRRRAVEELVSEAIRGPIVTFTGAAPKGKVHRGVFSNLGGIRGSDLTWQLLDPPDRAFIPRELKIPAPTREEIYTRWDYLSEGRHRKVEA